MENGLLFQGASADNHLLGAYLIESVTTNDRQPVISKPGVADCVGHTGNVAIGVDLLKQLIT